MVFFNAPFFLLAASICAALTNASPVPYPGQPLKSEVQGSYVPVFTCTDDSFYMEDKKTFKMVLADCKGSVSGAVSTIWGKLRKQLPPPSQPSIKLNCVTTVLGRVERDYPWVDLHMHCTSKVPKVDKEDVLSLPWSSSVH